MMKKTLCLLLLLPVLLAVLFSSCKTGETNEKSFSFSYGGVSAGIHDDVSPLLDALGEWKNYSESPSCGFEGLDKVYLYDGLRVTTYPDKSKDRIHSISILSDAYATPEGITVGSSEQDVISAFGEPTDRASSTLVYFAEGMKLQIIIRDGAVTNVQYLNLD